MQLQLQGTGVISNIVRNESYYHIILNVIEKSKNLLQ